MAETSWQKETSLFPVFMEGKYRAGDLSRILSDVFGRAVS